MFNFFTAIYVILELILGVMLCFFGVRFIRKIIMFAGAFAGFFIALIIAAPLAGVGLGLVIALVAAMVVGALAYFFYMIGIYIMGISAGVSVATILCSLIGIPQDGTLGIVIMVVFGIAALILVIKFRRVFVAISTSICGATHISSGIVALAGSGALTVGGALEGAIQWIGDNAIPAINGMSTMGAVITIVAAIAGIAVQLAVTAKKAGEKKI